MVAKDPVFLTSALPTAIAPVNLCIGHVQLRDLVLCPSERGIVNYLGYPVQAILEQDLTKPELPPRVIADLSNFSTWPISLTSLQFENKDVLFAAGGQEAELHLSYHSSTSSEDGLNKMVWEHETTINGQLNNSLLLTSLNISRSNESSIEPKLVVSNNDGTVKFFQVPIRAQTGQREIQDAGILGLHFRVNHTSISPDGRTLLSACDSDEAYLYRITGGERLDFSCISTLKLPPPNMFPLAYRSWSEPASFSTAFSADGTKFAITSQDGVVSIWDIRSTKTLKVFETDKMRVRNEYFDMNTYGSSAWSARAVKFSGGNGSGKEILVFAEHTSLLHIVDARTFETEEIIRVPGVSRSMPKHGPEDGSTDSSAEELEPEEAGAIGTDLKYEPEYREDLDIAGVCFDPTGGWMYAATMESVVEWGVEEKKDSDFEIRMLPLSQLRV